GTPLRPRRGRDPVSTLENLPRGLGQRSVLVRLRAQPRSLAIADADARVVLPAAVPRLLDGARRVVDSAVVVEPFSDRGNVAHGDAGRLRRRASTLSSGAALEASPARVAGLGRRLPSRSAGRSAARARAARARPLELEGLRQRRSAT